MANTTLDYTYDNAYQPHAVKTIALNGTGYNYTYDDNGNMLTGPDFTDPAQVATRTITYNADNMPVSSCTVGRSPPNLYMTARVPVCI
jgi:hypothetical protein